MPPRIPPVAACRGGFSLIEVAVALAVVVVVLTGVAGTWQSGQDRHRSAIDVTLAAQLAQRVTADVDLTDYPDLLRLAGIVGSPRPAMGWLPRRYFSYIGREVPKDDPERVYEVLTRVSHGEQLPANASGTEARWDAQGQLVLAIEVVTAPSGEETPVGADGLADRARCQRPVSTFSMVVGGSSKW